MAYSVTDPRYWQQRRTPYAGEPAPTAPARPAAPTPAPTPTYPTGSPAPTTISSPSGQSTVIPPPTTTKVPLGTSFGAPTPGTPLMDPARLPPDLIGGAMPSSVPPLSVPGGTTRSVTGGETPYTIGPSMGAGFTALLDRLRGEAGRQLDEPTEYDDSLFKSAFKQGTNLIDAELAGRGMARSSEADSRFQDLTTNLLRERAQALGSGRRAAFGNASGLVGLENAMTRGWRDEARGERNYLDDLRTQARGQSIEELLLGESLGRANRNEFQSILDRALGQGLPGLGYAGGAAGPYSSAAGQYGDLNQQQNAGLAELLELASILMQGG